MQMGRGGMKVVAYMLMSIIWVGTIVSWSFATGLGLISLIGACVFGVIFGLLLFRVSQYKEG